MFVLNTSSHQHFRPARKHGGPPGNSVTTALRIHRTPAAVLNPPSHRISSHRSSPLVAPLEIFIRLARIILISVSTSSKCSGGESALASPLKLLKHRVSRRTAAVGSITGAPGAPGLHGGNRHLLLSPWLQ